MKKMKIDIKVIASAIMLFVCSEVMAQFDVFGQMAPGKKPQTENTRHFNLPDKPNKLDAMGRKQGEWAKKYPNGQYMYVANFVDDKPVGTVVRYDERGRKSSEMKYATNGDADGVFYHENGKVASKGHYVKQQRDGEWLFYDESGVLVSRETYAAGKRSGTQFTYYDNGGVSIELNCSDDAPDGLWIQYYYTGHRQLEAHYTKGKLNGRYRYWNDGGSLSIDGMYADGFMVGDWKVYEDNGKGVFLMKYDNQGHLLNEDEVQRRMTSRLEYYERNRFQINDPQNYINSPEQYDPFSN